MGKKVASLYVELGADTTKLQTGLTDSKSKLSAFGGQLNTTVKNVTGFNLAQVGAATAVMAAGNAILKTANDWSVYAEDVEKAARLSGVSTEEMSRLIQASDDFRVSQDALKTSMVMALKNGFAPTIDNLADLSDEYNSLKNPTDKAALASKIFGRSYAEMEPLLRQGGDAIRAGTAAIDDNLIVTEEAVKNNKAYIAALDDFQDSWQGIKNEVGQNVLPVMTDLLNVVNGDINPNSIAGGAADKSSFQAILDFFDKSKNSKDDLKDVAIYGNDIGAAMAVIKAEAPGAAEGTQSLADATNNADLAMQKYTKALLFKMASEGLSEESALQLAYKMGLVDESTVLATEKTNNYKAALDNGEISLATYIALVDGLKRSIDGLSDKTVTVTYNQVTTGNPPQIGKAAQVEARAAGGNVSAGMPYLVGEAGPEIVVPPENGSVISNEKLLKLLGNGGRGGITITVNGAGEPSETARLISMNFKQAIAIEGM